MGVIPTEAIKFDTIQKYITLIGGILEQVRIKTIHPINNTNIIIKPLVRYYNTHKALYRWFKTRQGLELETGNDIWKYPIILFKLNDMQYSTDRFKISPLTIEGRKEDPTTQQAENVVNYIKNLIPFDYNFQIEMHSNVYSHLLDFIENFVVYFNPANTFTTTLLETKDSNDETILKLRTNSLIYINSFSLPQPPEEINEETNEPITSVVINLVVRGVLIPPIKDARLVKTLKTIFGIENDSGLIVPHDEVDQTI